MSMCAWALKHGLFYVSFIYDQIAIEYDPYISDEGKLWTTSAQGMTDYCLFYI